MCETLREPVNVLKSLTEKAISNKEYKFERLYRNLYNPEFYYLAYRNIYAAQGNMTSGSDKQTIDGMSEGKINRIIESLRDFSYQPKPARRTYIEKKGSDKKRPLGIPSTDDKLVQEVVRMILESIYEMNFSKRSHGFRPQKSCHTALLQIQDTFSGIRWFVEGDIKACFDSFDHHVLMNILRRRIADENFLALMWKFLKAGYMEQWQYHKTHSGVPQGAGISPMLANIYLHELDEYVEKYKEKFDKGKSHANLEYSRIASKLYYTRRKLNGNWDSMSESERKEIQVYVRELEKRLQSVPSKRHCDEEYKSIQYCRYADDFLVGIIGSREDAEQVKNDLKKFLVEELKLILSDEKTKITHHDDKARFLSYDITLSKVAKIVKDSIGRTKRHGNATVKLYVPYEKWFSKLIEYKAIKIVLDENGKEKWVTLHRGELVNREDIEIISQVNSEIRGMYNYYRIANNATVIKNFAHNLEYSMYKTLGNKYRASVKKIIHKYSRAGEFIVPYQTKTGMKECVLYNKGFARVKTPLFFDADTLPQYVRYERPNTIRARMKAGICEWCGCNSDRITMKHVRKLKDLQGETEWEQIMIEKRRKTLALCPECYEKAKIM